MSGCTEEHFVAQPAIQLRQDELGWEVEEMEILDFEWKRKTADGFSAESVPSDPGADSGIP